MSSLVLVPVAIHSIALELFKLDMSIHKDAVWPTDETYRENNCLKRWSTPFSLYSCAQPERYPDDPDGAAKYCSEDQYLVEIVGKGQSIEKTGKAISPLVVETQSNTRGLKMRSGNTSVPTIGTMAVHMSCSLRRDCEALLNLST